MIIYPEKFLVGIINTASFLDYYEARLYEVESGDQQKIPEGISSRIHSVP